MLTDQSECWYGEDIEQVAGNGHGPVFAGPVSQFSEYIAQGVANQLAKS